MNRFDAEVTPAGATPRQAFTLTRGAPLEKLNTFRAPARAAWLAEVSTAAAVPAVLANPELAGLPVFVLGGGSNVLLTRDVDGLVIHLEIHGIEILEDDRGAARVRVAAGESWDGFVRWSLRQGFAGLENLVLIPGRVGAAPIQNIGAYGTELSEFVAAVEAWDRDAGKAVRIANAECAFAYRDSLFKRRPGRYIVTAVEFALPRARPLRLDYAGVRQELAAMKVDEPDAADVARAVERLRRRKLPDPAKIGNAGSFFKNPVVSRVELEALRGRFPELPAHPYAGDRFKLSAAWLIEVCGLKGLCMGAAGVSDKHALVLVNRGGATGRDIWMLATHIRESVAARFGVMLEPEPVVI